MNFRLLYPYNFAKGSFKDTIKKAIESIIEAITIAKGVFKFFISDIIAIDN